MTLGTQAAESQEGTKDEAENANEEKMEEKSKKKVYPIAPDGYIPNSVIRKTMGFKPKDETKKEEPWKLKPLPASANALLESADEDDVKVLSYSDEEEEIDLEENLAESEEESEQESVRTQIQNADIDEAAAETEDADALLLEGDGRQTTDLPRETTPETVLESQRTPTPEKERKKSSAKKSVTIIEEAQEDDLHPLLREIVSRPWFPQSAVHSLVGVTSAFIGLMDVVNEDVHTDICNFIIRLHNEMGLPEKELNRIVEKLMQQLESTDATKRANAARTLAELGISTDGILTAVISKLIDEEEQDGNEDKSDDGRSSSKNSKNGEESGRNTADVATDEGGKIENAENEVLDMDAGVETGIGSLTDEDKRKLDDIQENDEITQQSEGELDADNTDDDFVWQPEVRKAAEMCLTQLKDDESKTRVVRYLQSIGAYTRTADKLTEEELLKALGIYLQGQGELDGGPESMDEVQDWLNGVLQKPEDGTEQTDKSAITDEAADSASNKDNENGHPGEDTEAGKLEEGQGDAEALAGQSNVQQTNKDEDAEGFGHGDNDDQNNRTLAADSGFINENDFLETYQEEEDEGEEEEEEDEGGNQNWNEIGVSVKEQPQAENWRDYFDKPRTKSAGQHAKARPHTSKLERRGTSFDSAVNVRMVTGITIHLQDSGSRGSAKSRLVEENEYDERGAFRPQGEPGVPNFGVSDAHWAGARQNGIGEHERSHTELSLPSINSASRFERYGGGSASQFGGGTSNQFLPHLPGSAQDHQGDYDRERHRKGTKGRNSSPYIPAPPKFHKHGRHDCLYYKMIRRGMHSHIDVGKYLLRKESMNMLANVKVPIKGLRTQNLLSS